MSIDSLYGDDEAAALYDLSFSAHAEDLLMHTEFARRGDTPSLELGAGTGRLALHLGRAGLRVVALDRSPAMLRRLERALDDELRARVRVVEADMRSFDLGEQFDVIHCVANTFQHLLTTADQVAALRCVAKHLAPGGTFVAGLASVSSVDWGAADGALRLRETFTDPESGERVMRFDAARAFANELRVERTFVYDRIAGDGSVRRRSDEVSVRYLTPSELRLLLSEAGLRVSQLYGGHDLSPFDEDSERMIVVAEHAG